MGKIIVGVDGSDGSLLALRWAVEEARLRSDELVAVHAWWYPVVTDVLGTVTPPPVDELREAAVKALDEAVDEAAGSADVHIERRVVEGRPARVLMEAAEGTDLLVVGSRGLGGFTELLLGSVSHQCVHHAPCPVVVVRERAD